MFLGSLPTCFSQQKGVEINKLMDIKQLKESGLKGCVLAMVHTGYRVLDLGCVHGLPANLEPLER